jgi:hypothetical protein
MAFDLSTAQPDEPKKKFDLSSAKPEEQPRRSPKQMYLSESDDPSKVGIFNALESVEKGIYEAGGKVTDVASKMGLPPAVAAGAGYLTNVGLNALGGGVGGDIAKISAVPLQKLSRWTAEELMGSALKPSVSQWKSGEGATAVKTMLEKGLNVTPKGITKLHTELESLQQRVSDAISKSGGTVSKADVVKTIEDAKSFFRGGTSEIEDMKIINDVVNQFEKAPSVKGLKDIPVQVAQRMKQLEYRKLDKAYGTLGDAEETARKGTARGLKEGIEKVAPEVKELNAEEAKIYQTLPVVERRAMMEINRNPGGLALLTHNPKVAAIFMGDKSSAFKSWLANKINEIARHAPSVARTAGQTGASLAEIGAQGSQP